MSVIGPRPGLWNQDILTAERDKYNANDVKPGLTGWAQINGRDELEIPEKATVRWHNNVQLKKITEKGMAENHFHLWGAAPYFQISWIWMMNHVGQVQNQTSLENMKENPRLLWWSSGIENAEGDLKKSCLQAALIRLYLYSLLDNIVCWYVIYGMRIAKTEEKEHEGESTMFRILHAMYIRIMFNIVSKIIRVITRL